MEEGKRSRATTTTTTTAKTYDFLVGELAAASDDVAVEGDARAAVEEDALAVAAAQVGVEVAAAAHGRRLAHQVHGHVGLAQLKVRARTVDDQLHAVQTCSTTTTTDKKRNG